MIQYGTLAASEMDTVVSLHLEGLTHELNLMNQIISGKAVDHSGTAQLKGLLARIIQVGEGQIFVARENGLITGYCLVTKKIYPVELPKFCGCINGIYVRPDARKAGIGRELFNHAVDWLKKDGIHYMELYHMINDPVATGFWQKMGFVGVQMNCVKIL